GAHLQTACLGGTVLLRSKPLGVGGVARVMTEMPEAADAVLASFLEQLSLLERRSGGRSLDFLRRSCHQRQMGIADFGTLDRLDAPRKVIEVLPHRQAVPDCPARHSAVMTDPIDRAHRPLLVVFLRLAEGRG